MYVFCPVYGLSKLGCPNVQTLNNLGGFMGNVSDVDLQKIFPKQKVEVVPQLPEEGKQGSLTTNL